MPFIAAASVIDFPDKIVQQRVKEQVLKLFSEKFPHAERLIGAFDNTEIATRNFCRPIEYYAAENTFESRNNDYIQTAVDYAVVAAEESIVKAGISKSEITDIVVVSTTGLATPSLDALVINRMRLNENTKRTPIWGLGCGGGVSGMAKANTIALANPTAVVLFISVELCSLTLIKSDYSKSNFIGSSLFSDGLAAIIIKGDEHPSGTKQVTVVNSQSRLYYDSLDVMGWDFMDDGFKVLFSKDIPAIIHQYVKNDAENFLASQGLSLHDIKNFIFHPGGKKVLDAYKSALGLTGGQLEHTEDVMKENGNMSSATVLYVLEKFLSKGYENGYGLMMAMGPGFSSEMVLLKMSN